MHINVKKILKITTITIITIIILLAFIILIFYRPVPLAGDTHYFIVLTGSMEPTLPVGSVIAIKIIDPNTLQIGDIICFQTSPHEPWATHRIINITDEGFITKGDANEEPDREIVKKENVIGKVALTIPYIGYLSYFVHTPLGLILLIIIPATLLIIGEARNIAKYRKEREKGGEQ
jgi:signal peptidase